LGCRNQFCDCLGDVGAGWERWEQRNRSMKVSNILRGSFQSRRRLWPSVRHPASVRRNQVGRICARLHQHDIDAELLKLITELSVSASRAYLTLRKEPRNGKSRDRGSADVDDKDHRVGTRSAQCSAH